MYKRAISAIFDVYETVCDISTGVLTPVLEWVYYDQIKKNIKYEAMRKKITSNRRLKRHLEMVRPAQSDI